MQAIKDAGILLVLVILIATVRITPIEALDGADPSLLAPPAQAATAPVTMTAPAARTVSLNEAKALAEIAIEAIPAEVIEHCARIVVELQEDLESPEQYVVVVEKEDKGAPCPRT